LKKKLRFFDGKIFFSKSSESIDIVNILHPLNGILIKTSYKNEYVDNVKLEEVSYQDINIIYCNKKFHMVFSFWNAEHETNHYLFYPVGIDLKKVSINSIKDNIKYDQKLETFRGINNGRGLIINLSIIGTVPHHMIISFYKVCMYSVNK